MSEQLGTWLGVVIITLGVTGIIWAVLTGSKSKTKDPNLDGLIESAKRLSKDDLIKVKEQAESYANRQRI